MPCHIQGWCWDAHAFSLCVCVCVFVIRHVCATADTAQFHSVYFEAMRLLVVPFLDHDWRYLKEYHGDIVRLQGLWTKAVHLFHPDQFVTVCHASASRCAFPHQPTHHSTAQGITSFQLVLRI